MAIGDAIWETMSKVQAIRLDDLGKEQLIFNSGYSAWLPHSHADIIEVYDLGNNQLLIRRFIEGELNFEKLVTLPENLDKGHFIAGQIGGMPELIKAISFRLIAPQYQSKFEEFEWDKVLAVLKSYDKDQDDDRLYVRESILDSLCDFVTQFSPWSTAFQEALGNADLEELIFLAQQSPQIN